MDKNVPDIIEQDILYFSVQFSLDYLWVNHFFLIWQKIMFEFFVCTKEISNLFDISNCLTLPTVNKTILVILDLNSKYE